MPEIALSLLVIKTHQRDKHKDFYSTLGLEFVEEQHGSGPLHYAAKLSHGVFEIYPLPDEAESDSSTRVGFNVLDLATTLTTLHNAGFCEPKSPKQTPWGLRAVVHDPDGHAVELYQSPDP